MHDLTRISYEGWLDFVFDHPVPQLRADAHLRPGPPAWHFQKEWDYKCDANTLISHLSSLFNHAEPLVIKYSMRQLDQGFWFIPSSNGFMWSILSPEVEIYRR